MPSRWWVTTVAGVACAGTGVWIVLTAPRGPGFGWTAYAPLSATAYQPPEPGWSFVLGLVLALLGAATVGASSTALVAQARARRVSPPVDPGSSRR